jgi:RHS family protein
MNGKILEETQPGLNPEGYVSIPFLFQGQYYDHETGLAYNRFRYYDPELGRYISEDPIRLESGTLALHSYIEDVNSWVDVLGLSASTYRVRHYSNKAGITGIQKEQKIKAKDKGSVFTGKAKGIMTKGSSIDIEKRLGIKEGRGKHFVVFDASSSEVTVVTNPVTGATEYIFSGDVLLDNREPIFSPL